MSTATVPTPALTESDIDLIDRIQNDLDELINRTGVPVGNWWKWWKRSRRGAYPIVILRARAVWLKFAIREFLNSLEDEHATR